MLSYQDMQQYARLIIKSSCYADKQAQITIFVCVCVYCVTL